MLKVASLSVSYLKRGPLTIEGVSFSLPGGKIGLLLGPNGAGKSTLFKALLGSVEIRGGSIELDGLNKKEAKRKEWARKVAYVPQRLPSSRLSVYETVMLGRTPYFSFSPSKQDHLKTEEVIKELNLEGIADKYSDEISGGELQKVAIATALNQEPSLLLLDEPSSNLDIKNCILLQELCLSLAARHNISILIATHDLNFALDLGDYFFFLKKGKIVGQGGKEAFSEDNVFATFGVHVSISDFGGDKHIHYHTDERSQK